MNFFRSLSGKQLRRHCLRLVEAMFFGAVAYGSVIPGLAAEPNDPDAASPSADHLRLFEESVLAIFQEHCFECHSAEEHKGGLSLQSRAGLVTGGDSGPGFDEANPEASLILEAVRYEGYEMPPRGKLPQELIDKIEQWVAAGAPYSPEMQGDQAHQRALPPGAEITSADRQF